MENRPLSMLQFIKENKEKSALTVVLFLIAFGVTSDLIDDYSQGLHFSHYLVEGFVVASSLCIIVYLWVKKTNLIEEVRTLSLNLASANEQAAKWKNENRKFILGLSSAIDRQFSDWSFTKAEKEISYLLLKGLSIKEIAHIRGTSENTIRLQMHSIYSKSGLNGRSDLAAYFLEDILGPQDQGPESS